MYDSASAALELLMEQERKHFEETYEVDLSDTTPRDIVDLVRIHPDHAFSKAVLGYIEVRGTMGFAKWAEHNGSPHVMDKLFGTEKVRIVRDSDPRNPREDDDGLMGTMTCFHGRYKLGDKHDWDNPKDFQESDELKNAIASLPLYLLDHSGLAISTTEFSCPWDSGQVGMIYVTAARFKELRCRDFTPDDLPELLAELRAGVETYDQYLKGDVYGVQILEDGEVTDSCYGFYGRDWAKNGVLEHVPAHLADQKLWEIVD